MQIVAQYAAKKQVAADMYLGQLFAVEEFKV
jgi:hypothetical protein